jgi:hypothetical protein
LHESGLRQKKERSFARALGFSPLVETTESARDAAGA